MKLETVVVILKGATVTGMSALTALSTGLAQWVESDVAPGKIAWTIIISGSLAAGLSSLSGFLSSAFGKYLNERNGNGNGKKPEPTPPKPPTP